VEDRNRIFRQKRFLAIDRLLIRLATVAVVLLLVAQTLLLSGETRKYLSLVDRLEGEQIMSPVNMYAADAPWSNPNNSMNAVNKVVTKSIRTLRPNQKMSIRMINPPASLDAIVTVNGEIAGNFGRGLVELTIYDGDYIEIDAVNVKKHAQFIIDSHRSQLAYPVGGIVLESKNNMIIVGKVVFKR